MTEGLSCVASMTTPQAKIKDFCQLPLHRGAFAQPADRTYVLTRHARNRGLCPHMKNPRFLSGVRKTVNPPYEIFIGRIFVYTFDAEASKAPSDEGAVSEAD